MGRSQYHRLQNGTLLSVTHDLIYNVNDDLVIFLKLLLFELTSYAWALTDQQFQQEERGDDRWLFLVTPH